MADIELALHTTRRFGTGLSTDTKPSGNVDDLIFETDTGDLYRCYGTTNWQKVRIAGAALVSVTGIGQTGPEKNRLIPALNVVYARATNGADFSGVGGIVEAYITIIPAAAGVAGDLSKKAQVTFDAPNEATASAFLASAGGQAVPVLKRPLILGVRNGPYTFKDANGVPFPINWIDIATDVTAIAFIEGV